MATVICAVAAPLVAMKDGATSLVAMAIAVACGAAGWFAVKRLRPQSRTSVLALFLLVGVTFVSSLGMKSLWLSLFGEPTRSCAVTERLSHTPSRSPTYYWNELACGSSQITYRPSTGHSTKPVGERIDLVVDSVGFAGYSEPDRITPQLSLLVGLAALIGALYIGFVLLWPRRAAKNRPNKPQVDRGFL